MKQDVYEVRDIFHVIRHYFWTIFTITLLVTAIGAFITYFILTPVYQAKTQVLILDTTIYKDKKESREEPSPAPSEEPSPAPSEEPSPTPSEEPSPTPSEGPSPTPSEEPIPIRSEVSSPTMTTEQNKVPVIKMMKAPSTVNVAKEADQKPDIAYDQSLKETYIDLITSPRILSIVNNKLDGKAVIKENELKIESIEDSQVITILVENEDRDKAVLIADTIVETFQEEAFKLTTVDNIHLLMEAKAGATPIRPIPLLYVGISVVVGLMMGMAVAFLLGLFREAKNKKG